MQNSNRKVLDTITSKTKIYLALLSFNNSRMIKVRCILNDDIYIHDAGYVKM